MEAQHDVGRERPRPPTYQHRPHLEELGGRTLNQRVSGVSATTSSSGTGLVDVAILGLTRSHANPSTPDGEDVGTGLAVGCGSFEHPHGDGVVALQALQCSGRLAGRGSVHRSEDGHLGDVARHTQSLCHRLVEIWVLRRSDEGRVTGHGCQHTGFDLPEVGSNKPVAIVCGDHGPHDGREVVQPGRRRHSPGCTVGARPITAETAVRHVLIEPCVPVGRGDALGLSPDEKCIDERIGALQLLQAPGTGVGKVEAGSSEHRLHLGRITQIDVLRRLKQPEHGPVPAFTFGVLFDAIRRSGAGSVEDDAIRLGLIDWEAVVGEFGAQHLGG